VHEKDLSHIEMFVNKKYNEKLTWTEGRQALGSGEATGWPFLFQISRAKRIARPTSTIFPGGKDVINDPIFPFETVCKWSQLTAQSKGTPSAFERNTSDGMLRTVLVMGATVTSPRYSKTESRVRIRTGLFLSGRVNLYQRISPCFIRHPKLAQFPKPKTHRQQLAAVRTLGGAHAPVAQGCSGQVPHEAPFW